MSFGGGYRLNLFASTIPIDCSSIITPESYRLALLYSVALAKLRYAHNWVSLR
jgi:hypothetical protein